MTFQKQTQGDPKDRVWVDGTGKLVHVREMSASHLRRLIKTMRGRVSERELILRDLASDCRKFSEAPEVLKGIFAHEEELQKQCAEARGWLDVFEEEKARRNMVDTEVDVEWI